MRNMKNEMKTPFFVQRKPLRSKGRRGKRVKRYIIQNHKWVSLLICLIGCCFQMKYISRQYFDYETITEIFIQKPYYIVLPAFTVCVPFPQVIDRRKLPPKFDNFSEYDIRNNVQATEALQESLAMKQIFKMCPDFQGLAYLAVHKAYNSYEYEWRHKFLVITKFIKDYFICYTFGHKNQSDPNFGFKSKHINFGRLPGVLFKLHLNKSKLSKVDNIRIYLHPLRRLPRGDDDFVLNIHTDLRTEVINDTTYAISYSRFTEELMGPPYKSNCKPFPTTTSPKFESETHCFDHCLKKRSLAAFRRIPFSVTITHHEHYKGMSKYGIIRNKTLGDAFNLMEEACVRVCSQPDCFQDHFVPKLIAKEEDESTKYGPQVIFNLFSPDQPDTTVHFLPKLPFSEYIIYLMSLVGIYFGFAFLPGIEFVFNRLLSQI